MEVVNSFRCIYIISRLLGLFPYVSEKTTYGSVFKINKRILFRSRIICAAITVIRVVTFIFEEAKSYIWGFSAPGVFRTTNTIILYTIAVTVYRSIVKRSPLVCDWLNKINEVYISVNVNVHPLIVFDRLIVAFSLTFFFVTNTPACVWLWTNAKFIDGFLAFFDSLCFIFWLAIENLSLCQFLTFTNVTRVGFERLNEILGGESLKYESNENLAERVNELRVQHLLVTDFYDFLNTYFGLNLFIYIFWSFCSILFCAVSFVLFDLHDAMTLLIWSTYHLCQIIPIVYMCDAVYLEANRAVKHLDDLLLDYEDKEIKEEVELFLLQIQHRQADFSVFGFYNLDFPLLHGMVAAVTTYIIALIQVPFPGANARRLNVTSF